MEGIDRYSNESDPHFLNNPKRAGKSLWGKERTASEFSAGNNCKDPALSIDRSHQVSSRRERQLPGAQFHRLNVS
jgi:hypothetical protein